MNGDFIAHHDDSRSPLLLPLHDHQIQRSESSYKSSYSSCIKSFFTLKTLYIILGPLLCTILCLTVKFDGPATSGYMLGVLVWVFTWWMTDAVPMPITSMSPLFLFPLFGISTADDVIKTYMDDVITLVLGSFILALAVEHYNIHRRLALNITRIFCGDPVNPQLLLLGICGTTAFISMWMHNTVVAIMMMPVATGILQKFPTDPHQSDVVISKFCKAVVLGVIYSATIGGMSTLTGTGVNLILIGMWKSYFPEENSIGFNTWICFGLPLAFIIFILMWAMLCWMYCPRGSGRTLSTYLDKDHLRRELELLGPMSFAEKTILSVFSILIFLWMTKTITDDIPGWSYLFNDRVGDGTVSVMMATLLFIIPNKKQAGEKLMDWNKCKKLPWNIVLLLGAGLAIADGVRSSGFADELSKPLAFLEEAPYLAIAPAVCLISGLLTELITSNNATTTLIVPLLIEIAKTMHVHPLLLMIPGAIGAQFAFMLPTSTPSNVIGFSTGHIEIKDTLKVGTPLKLVGIAAVSILMPTLGALVFGTDTQKYDT